MSKDLEQLKKLYDNRNKSYVQIDEDTGIALINTIKYMEERERRMEDISKIVDFLEFMEKR